MILVSKADGDRDTIDDYLRELELIQEKQVSMITTLHEKLLELRTTVQGEDHWETISQRWKVTQDRKVAATSPAQRSGWRTANDGLTA